MRRLRIPRQMCHSAIDPVARSVAYEPAIGYRHAPRAHRVLVKLRVRIEPPGESRDCSAHGPRSSGEESPVVSFKSGPN